MRFNPLKPQGNGNNKKKAAKPAATPPAPSPSVSSAPSSVTLTVTENEAKDGFELRFPGPPPAHILTMLRQTRHLPDRAHKWSYHFMDKFWYAKRNAVTRAFVLALQASAPTPAPAPNPATLAPAQPTMDRVVVPVDFGTTPEASVPLWKRRLRPGTPPPQ